MKRVQWFIVLILAGMVFFAGSVNAQVTSALWGVDGDAWNTNGILRDFTDVGYKGGAEPIPDWTNGVSVLDYGAVPDDGIDDSDAFIAAISNCPNYSAVFVPKGRYLITKKIVIERSYVVLRGEDMYESILFFPKNVSEVYIETVGWNADDKVRNTVYDPWITVTAGQEKGIENLAIEFREQRKIKNWEYIGANALRFQGDGGVVSNCWARNLYIKNYDMGIGVNFANNVTVANIIFDQFIGRQAVDGDIYGKTDAYSAVLPRNIQKCLFHNIDITGHLLQPVDNNDSSRDCVFSKISTGEGNNRVVGLHGGTAKGHLYTELNRAITRGDLGDPGPYTSWSECTYWNVNSEVTENTYLNSQIPHIFVGYGDDWSITSNATFYYEPAAYGQLVPTNLYLAQLEYFKKPLPEGLSVLPLEPYEREGDVFRVVPTDDVTPDKTYDSNLTLKDGAYFKFDLSQATETNVAAARLRVTLERIRNAPFRVAAYSVSDDSWVETNLTTSNKPEVGSELSSEWIHDSRSNLVVELDVTSFVENELVGGDGVISLYVDYPEGSGFLSTAWCAEVGQKPELIVERVADSVPGAPGAPKGIRSTALIGNISLDWDDNPESDVATYNVYRSSPADGWLPQSGGLVTSDHVDVSSTDDWHVGMMDYNKVYHYWITAVDEHGYESEKSKEFVAAVVHPSNAPPAFVETVSLSNAVTEVEYTDSLAGEASDPESDPMYFMKVSGPDWLTVDLDGTLSGMPAWSDEGTNAFTFQVTAIGGSTQKVVNITVELPADDPPGAPAAPTNLVAAVDYNTVRLEWDDNTEADLAGYTIYRALTSGSYGDALATNSPLSSDYVDSTALNGTTYYYVVAAFDDNSNVSAYSEEASGTPVDKAPAAPTGLTAAAGDASVALQWTANDESDLESYRVYRSTTSSNYPDTALATVSSNTYVDKTVVNETTYYYAVTAVDNGGNESVKSSEISETPAEPNAKVVAYYPFSGSTLASADPETNSVAGDMVVGTGISTFVWETRGFWVPNPPAAGFDASSDCADGTVLDTDYFSFTITPEADVTLDFISLSFVDRTGGFSFSVASDQDNFATVIDSAAAAGTGEQMWGTNTLDLASLSSATGATEIRLYFHDGSGAQNVRVDNIEITANVVSGPPPLEGYDLWATEWNTDIGAATNDFDADGLSNFGEYALGGNPTNSLAQGTLPVFSKSGSGFIYVHPMRSDDGAITYLVETTTNLISGVWTHQGVTAIGTNVTGETLNFITNEVGTLEKDKFIRLKIGP